MNYVSLCSRAFKVWLLPLIMGEIEPNGAVGDFTIIKGNSKQIYLKQFLPINRISSVQDSRTQYRDSRKKITEP